MNLKSMCECGHTFGNHHYDSDKKRCLATVRDGLKIEPGHFYPFCSCEEFKEDFGNYIMKEREKYGSESI